VENSGGGASVAFATASDNAGNLYITGSFTNTVTFGSTTLTSDGGDDIYVAKWSPTAGFMWAKRAGGTGAEHANAIAINGNQVFVTGVYNSRAASFGNEILENADLNGLTNDGFVTKLIDSGTSASFAWSKAFGGSAIEFGNAIAASGTNVYLTGLFSSPTITFGASTLTSAGGADAFVAKLTDNGSSGGFVWAQRAGGNGYDLAVGIAVSGTNVYMAGSYSGITADFGSQTLTNYSAAPNADDVFVSKLVDNGTTGSFVWTQRAGGDSYDQVTKMAVNGNSLYVGGRFYSPVATFGNTILNNANTNISEDGFLTKLTDNGATGSFNWTKQIGGIGRDYIRVVAVRGSKVFVAGDFQQTATAGNTTLTSAGNSDGFVALINDQGNTASYDWSQRLGGVGNDYAYGMALSGSHVFVAGAVSTPASIGQFVLPGTPGVSASFLASIIENTISASAASQLAAEVTVFPNPAHGQATVEVPAVQGAASASFAVLDAVGRVVRSASAGLPAAGLRYTLPLEGLPAGVYTLQVKAGAVSAARRLVVE